MTSADTRDNFVRPGSTEVLSSEPMHQYRTRSVTEKVFTQDELVGRIAQGSFKHGFCDYDISQMNSEVQSKLSSCSSVSANEAIFVRDERWYDKSSAAYFTSKATRNAQTISWKQRHRPIFQMYVDLQCGLLMGFVCMYMSVNKLASNESFADIFLTNILLMIASVNFFLKFLFLASIYRCTSHGNILERTKCIFWTR